MNRAQLRRRPCDLMRSQPRTHTRTQGEATKGTEARHERGLCPGRGGDARPTSGSMRSYGPERVRRATAAARLERGSTGLPLQLSRGSRARTPTLRPRGGRSLVARWLESAGYPAVPRHRR